MATRHGEPPRKRLKVEDILEEQGTKTFFGQRKHISLLPGIYKVVPRESIFDALKRVLKARFFPVTLKTVKKNHGDKPVREVLSECSKDNLQFSKIGSRVTAEVTVQDDSIVYLRDFLPKLNESVSEDGFNFSQYLSLDLLPSAPLITVELLFKQICTNVTRVIKDLKDSNTSQRETHDHSLWISICNDLIISDSVVYKECIISSETLPHGHLDIVAGGVGNSLRDNTWKLAVVLKDEDLELEYPIAVSAKTRSTLPTKPPSAQVVFETLAFSETLLPLDDKLGNVPTVVFAGSREAFRPYIRLRNLDLLYTTEECVPWWDPIDNLPDIDGLTFLIILMLAAASIDPFQFSCDRLPSISLPKTGWKDYYNNAETKYENEIRPQKQLREKPYTCMNHTTTSTTRLFATDEELTRVSTLRRSH